MTSETFRQNKKRKEKYSKNFVSPDILSDKFQQIVLKICKLYLFYPFPTRFFCIKFPFKNFIICVIFSNQYPN